MHACMHARRKGSKWGTSGFQYYKKGNNEVSGGTRGEDDCFFAREIRRRRRCQQRIRRDRSLRYWVTYLPIPGICLRKLPVLCLYWGANRNKEKQTAISTISMHYLSKYYWTNDDDDDVSRTTNTTTNDGITLSATATSLLSRVLVRHQTERTTTIAHSHPSNNRSIIIIIKFDIPSSLFWRHDTCAAIIMESGKQVKFHLAMVDWAKLCLRSLGGDAREQRSWHNQPITTTLSTTCIRCVRRYCISSMLQFLCSWPACCCCCCGWWWWHKGKN